MEERRGDAVGAGGERTAHWSGGRRKGHTAYHGECYVMPPTHEDKRQLSPRITELIGGKYPGLSSSAPI